jgi:hypothetical protein
MASRQVIAVAAAVAVAMIGTGCGGKENAAFSPDRQKQFDDYAKTRRADVEKKVRSGALPPQALLVIRPNGTANANFIKGPNFDKDIVRTRSGKKLAWDLNQDGKIEKSERTITERDLYNATLARQ